MRTLRLKDLRIGCFVMCTLRASKLMHPSILPLTIVPKPHYKMVHSDLAGPNISTAKVGFRYAICFVDDYSGFVSHYFMRNKSDAIRATAQFLADVSAIGIVKVLRMEENILAMSLKIYR